MPVTGRYNLVKIGDIYLTDTGLVDGKPCKVEVSGVDQLKGAFSGVTVRSASNAPYTFIMNNTLKGSLLVLSPFVIMDTVLDDLEDAFDVATLAGDTLPLILEGDTGTFNLEVTGYYADGVKPIQFTGEFNRGRIYGVKINLVVAGLT